ncbi:hypothetical protein N7504_009473 [Penicillium tannophilum]|nr:hypothetical protein N7504_009473 [Penicillium tannophilum]
MRGALMRGRTLSPGSAASWHAPLEPESKPTPAATELVARPRAANRLAQTRSRMIGLPEYSDCQNIL